MDYFKPIQPISPLSNFREVSNFRTLKPLQPLQGFYVPQNTYKPTGNVTSDPRALNSMSDVLFNKRARDRVAYLKGTEGDWLGTTVYAGLEHLSKSFVQPVLDGDMVGLVVNSLNSFGEDADLVSNFTKGMIVEAGTQESSLTNALVTSVIALGIASGVGAPLSAVLAAGVISGGVVGTGTAVLADPEGAARGLARAGGWTDEGKYNYQFDTGNYLFDMYGEVVMDPLNWVSMGSAAAGSLVQDAAGKSAIKLSAASKNTLNLISKIGEVDNLVTKAAFLSNPIGLGLYGLYSGSKVGMSASFKSMQKIITSGELLKAGESFLPTSNVFNVAHTAIRKGLSDLRKTYPDALNFFKKSDEVYYSWFQKTQAQMRDLLGLTIEESEERTKDLFHKFFVSKDLSFLNDYTDSVKDLEVYTGFVNSLKTATIDEKMFKKTGKIVSEFGSAAGYVDSNYITGLDAIKAYVNEVSSYSTNMNLFKSFMENKFANIAMEARKELGDVYGKSKSEYVYRMYKALLKDYPELATMSLNDPSFKSGRFMDTIYQSLFKPAGVSPEDFVNFHEGYVLGKYSIDAPETFIEAAEQQVVGLKEAVSRSFTESMSMVKAVNLLSEEESVLLKALTEEGMGSAKSLIRSKIPKGIRAKTFFSEYLENVRTYVTPDKQAAWLKLVEEDDGAKSVMQFARAYKDIDDKVVLMGELGSAFGIGDPEVLDYMATLVMDINKFDNGINNLDGVLKDIDDYQASKLKTRKSGRLTDVPIPAEIPTRAFGFLSGYLSLSSHSYDSIVKFFSDHGVDGSEFLSKLKDFNLIRPNFGLREGVIKNLDDTHAMLVDITEGMADQLTRDKLIDSDLLKLFDAIMDPETPLGRTIEWIAHSDFKQTDMDEISQSVKQLYATLKSFQHYVELSVKLKNMADMTLTIDPNRKLITGMKVPAKVLKDANGMLRLQTLQGEYFDVTVDELYRNEAYAKWLKDNNDTFTVYDLENLRLVKLEDVLTDFDKVKKLEGDFKKALEEIRVSHVNKANSDLLVKTQQLEEIDKELARLKNVEAVNFLVKQEQARKTYTSLVEQLRQTRAELRSMANDEKMLALEKQVSSAEVELNTLQKEFEFIKSEIAMFENNKQVRFKEIEDSISTVISYNLELRDQLNVVYSNVQTYVRNDVARYAADALRKSKAEVKDQLSSLAFNFDDINKAMAEHPGVTYKANDFFSAVKRMREIEEEVTKARGIVEDYFKTAPDTLKDEYMNTVMHPIRGVYAPKANASASDNTAAVITKDFFGKSKGKKAGATTYQIRIPNIIFKWETDAKGNTISSQPLFLGGYRPEDLGGRKIVWNSTRSFASFRQFIHGGIIEPVFKQEFKLSRLSRADVTAFFKDTGVDVSEMLEGVTTLDGLGRFITEHGYSVKDVQTFLQGKYSKSYSDMLGSTLELYSSTYRSQLKLRKMDEEATIEAMRAVIDHLENTPDFEEYVTRNPQMAKYIKELKENIEMSIPGVSDVSHIPEAFKDISLENDTRRLVLDATLKNGVGLDMINMDEKTLKGFFGTNEHAYPAYYKAVRSLYASFFDGRSPLFSDIENTKKLTEWQKAFNDLSETRLARERSLISDYEKTVSELEVEMAKLVHARTGVVKGDDSALGGYLPKAIAEVEAKLKALPFDYKDRKSMIEYAEKQAYNEITAIIGPKPKMIDTSYLVWDEKVINDFLNGNHAYTIDDVKRMFRNVMDDSRYADRNVYIRNHTVPIINTEKALPPDPLHDTTEELIPIWIKHRGNNNNLIQVRFDVPEYGPLGFNEYNALKKDEYARIRAFGGTRKHDGTWVRPIRDGGRTTYDVLDDIRIINQPRQVGTPLDINNIPTEVQSVGSIYAFGKSKEYDSISKFVREVDKKYKIDAPFGIDVTKIESGYINKKFEPFPGYPLGTVIDRSLDAPSVVRLLPADKQVKIKALIKERLQYLDEHISEYKTDKLVKADMADGQIKVGDSVVVQGFGSATVVDPSSTYIFEAMYDARYNHAGEITDVIEKGKGPKVQDYPRPWDPTDIYKVPAKFEYAEKADVPSREEWVRYQANLIANDPSVVVVNVANPKTYSANIFTVASTQVPKTRLNPVTGQQEVVKKANKVWQYRKPIYKYGTKVEAQVGDIFVIPARVNPDQAGMLAKVTKITKGAEDSLTRNVEYVLQFKRADGTIVPQSAMILPRTTGVNAIVHSGAAHEIYKEFDDLVAMRSKIVKTYSDSLEKVMIRNNYTADDLEAILRGFPVVTDRAAEGSLLAKLDGKPLAINQDGILYGTTTYVIDSAPGNMSRGKKGPLVTPEALGIMLPGSVTNFSYQNDAYKFLGNEAFVNKEHRIQFHGLSFSNVQSAFIASRFKRLSDMQAIQEMPTAAKADVLARELIAKYEKAPEVLRNNILFTEEEYRQNGVDLMYGFLRQKFSDPEFADALVQTGNAPLVNGVRYGDDFWGVKTVSGENMLGMMLMRLRGELGGEGVVPWRVGQITSKVSDVGTGAQFEGATPGLINKLPEARIDAAPGYKFVSNKEMTKVESELPFFEGTITKLKPNEVFVFGANEEGIHGAGAAKQAFEKFGAKKYTGSGLQGQSYGVVTRFHDEHGKLTTHELTDISNEIDKLVEFAGEHPNFRFLVTDIGTGLAGVPIDDIADMFLEWDELPPNLIFSKEMYRRIYGEDALRKLDTVTVKHVFDQLAFNLDNTPASDLKTVFTPNAEVDLMGLMDEATDVEDIVAKTLPGQEMGVGRRYETAEEYVARVKELRKKEVKDVAYTPAELKEIELNMGKEYPELALMFRNMTPDQKIEFINNPYMPEDMMTTHKKVAPLLERYKHNNELLIERSKEYDKVVASTKESVGTRLSRLSGIVKGQQVDRNVIDAADYTETAEMRQMFVEEEQRLIKALNEHKIPNADELRSNIRKLQADRYVVNGEVMKLQNVARHTQSVSYGHELRTNLLKSIFGADYEANSKLIDDVIEGRKTAEEYVIIKNGADGVVSKNGEIMLSRKYAKSAILNRLESFAVVGGRLSAPVFGSNNGEKDIAQKFMNRALDILSSNKTSSPSELLNMLDDDSLKSALRTVSADPKYDRVIDSIILELRNYLYLQSQLSAMGGQTIMFPDTTTRQLLEDIMNKYLPDFVGRVNDPAFQVDLVKAKAKAFIDAFTQSVPDGLSFASKLDAVEEEVSNIRAVARRYFIMGNDSVKALMQAGDIVQVRNFNEEGLSTANVLLRYLNAAGRVLIEEDPEFAGTWAKMSDVERLAAVKARGIDVQVEDILTDTYSNMIEKQARREIIVNNIGSVGNVAKRTELLTAYVNNDFAEVHKLNSDIINAEFDFTRQIMSGIRSGVADALYNEQMLNRSMLKTISDVEAELVRSPASAGGLYSKEGYRIMADRGIALLHGILDYDSGDQEMFARLLRFHTPGGLLVIDKTLWGDMDPRVLKLLEEEYGISYMESLGDTVNDLSLSVFKYSRKVDAVEALGPVQGQIKGFMPRLAGLNPMFEGKVDAFFKEFQIASKQPFPFHWSDMPLYRFSDEFLPKWLVERGLITLEESKIYASALQDSGMLGMSVLGDERFLRSIMPTLSSNPMQLMLNSGYQMGLHSVSKAKFIRMFMGPEWKIDTLFGTSDPAQAYEIFNSMRKELEVVLLDNNLEAHRVPMNSVSDMAYALKNGAILTNYPGFLKMYHAMDNWKLPALIDWMERNVGSVYKAGVMTSFGLGVRNFFDNNVKMIMATGSLDSLSYIPVAHHYIGRFAEIAKDMHDFQDGRVALAYLQKLSDDDLKMYFLMTQAMEMQTSGAPLDAVLDVTKAARLAKEARGVAVDQGSFIQNIAWGNPLTQASLWFQNYTEQRWRLAAYLYMMDAGKSASETAKTVAEYFIDYSIKGKALKVMNVLVPFSMFTIKNTLLWAEHATENPMLLRTLVDMGAYSWNRVKAEQQGYMSPQQRDKFASGNAALGNMILKVNPSFFDAASAIPGLIKNPLERLSPVIKNAGKLLEGNLDEIALPWEGVGGRANVIVQGVQKLQQGQSTTLADFVPSVFNGLTIYDNRYSYQRQGYYRPGTTGYATKMAVRNSQRIVRSSVYARKNYYKSIWGYDGKPRFANPKFKSTMKSMKYKF